MAMSRKVLTVSLPLAAAFLVTLAAASDAHALDGYRSRKGLFLGGNFGGGMGSSDSYTCTTGCTGEVASTRLSDGLGLAGRLRVGAGPFDWFTFDVSGGVWSRGVEKNGVEQIFTLYDMMVGANVFLFGTGFYGRAAGGMSFAKIEREGLRKDTDLGLVASLGGGLEFFVNSDLAVGMGLEFQRHQVSPSVNVILGTVSATWY